MWKEQRFASIGRRPQSLPLVEFQFSKAKNSFLGPNTGSLVTFQLQEQLNALRHRVSNFCVILAKDKYSLLSPVQVQPRITNQEKKQTSVPKETHYSCYKGSGKGSGRKNNKIETDILFGHQGHSYINLNQEHLYLHGQLVCLWDSSSRFLSEI